LETAMQHFQESLNLNSNNAAAHLNLARGLTLLGRIGRAEEHYQRAAALKPEDPEALLAYGHALAENRQLARATEQVQEAIKRKPTTRGRLLLAAILTAQNHNEAAADQYEKVLETEPDSLEALNNLAWLRATANNPQEQSGTEALRLARRACELTNHKQPLMLVTLSAAWAATGDLSNAVWTVEAAIQIASEDGNMALANRSRQMLQEFQRRRERTALPPD